MSVWVLRYYFRDLQTEGKYRCKGTLIPLDTVPGESSVLLIYSTSTELLKTVSNKRVELLYQANGLPDIRPRRESLNHVAVLCRIPDEDPECALYRVDMDEDHKSVRTACHHIFGAACLNNWISIFKWDTSIAPGADADWFVFKQVIPIWGYWMRN
jgi:hypothetical protein